MDDQPLDELTKKRLAESEGAPEFPGEQIRSRIQDSLQRQLPEPAVGHTLPGFWTQALRLAAAAAAGIFVFFLGAEYGRRAGASSAEPLAIAHPATPARLSVPAHIQAQGTAYVTALSDFSGSVEALTPLERAQAREVALAVLHGAALELLRATPEDPIAAAVFQSIAADRDAQRGTAQRQDIYSF